MQIPELLLFTVVTKWHANNSYLAFFFFSPVLFLVLKQKGSLIQPAPIFYECELSWQNMACSLTVGRVMVFSA